MWRRPFTTLEDQTATFIELFFDLVFVFAVTQVVALVHHEGLSWEGAAHAAIVFWLVWWGWTQYTWALNSADTTHPSVEVGVLVATALAFLMAVAIPEAFEGSAGWFASMYLAVRLLGLAIYARVAWDDPAKRSALVRFVAPSVLGMAAVAAGAFADGDARAWIWASAILFDLVAAAIGGQSEGWDLRPDHFGERHGLFVIIVLGESLIAAGSGLTFEGGFSGTVAIGVLAVVLTCGLWWSYFIAFRPSLVEAIAECQGSVRSALARDAYSILHFPLVFGVVLLAVAIEEAVAHPAEPLPDGGVLALAAGIALFLAATVAAKVRARRASPVLWVRVAVIVAVGVAVAATSPLDASWPMLAAALCLLALAIADSFAISRSASHQFLNEA